MSKFNEYLELIKLLRIDVYMALFMFGYGVYQVPVVEFVQDKVCLNVLGYDAKSCSSLSSGELAELQSKVLAEATSIRNQQTLMSTIPGVIQSFFFGYWIDKYPSHIRLLLTLPCIGMFVQTASLIFQCLNFQTSINLTLWSYLALGLGGGQSLALAASFTYAARKTPQKYRSIRFAIVDFFIFTAYPLGIAVGGKILASNSWFANEERNFSGVFLASSITMAIAIIWAILLITDSGSPSDEKNSGPSGSGREPSSSNGGNTTMTEVDLNDATNENDKPKDESKQGVWAIASDIFNLTNIYLTLKTFFRYRPDNGRIKVSLLSFSVLVVFISLLGEGMFGFQYTEKAFLWNYSKYSNISAFLTIAQSIGTVAGSLFFGKTLKLGDAEIAAIGTLSHFLGNIIRGIPKVACFITGSLTFCMAGIAIPAIRSCLTHIIDYNEIGQILAIVACFQAMGPLLASVITTAVFEATLDTAPGTAFHVLASLVVVPLFILLWISLITDVKKYRKNSSPKVGFNKDTENVNVEGLRKPDDETKF